MLDGLRAAIARDGIGNIQPWQLAWDDDWSAVPRCDVAIASRSLMVPDLAQALAKLDAHARRRACITFTTGPRAGVTELAALLGRAWIPMPDHRYPINLLLDMGREPRVDYLPLSPPDRERDAEELLQQVESLFGGLTPAEQQSVRAWHAASPDNRLGLAPTRRWAFIWWETAG